MFRSSRMILALPAACSALMAQTNPVVTEQKMVYSSNPRTVQVAARLTF